MRASRAYEKVVNEGVTKYSHVLHSIFVADYVSNDVLRYQTGADCV